MKLLRVAGWTVRAGDPFFVVAGPCVIESEQHCVETACALAETAARLELHLIFKASFDKANRTSLKSYRGPGLDRGLRILERTRRESGLPVLSDVHEAGQTRAAAEVLDVLQIPAFLCRQTDLILAAVSTGKPVNIKKGQFLAPWDMRHVVEKAESVPGAQLMLTERGSCFGYNHLVVDFKALPVMRQFGWPVVFDATHSVQLPGGQGDISGGQAEFIPVLARAAAAVGVDGLFFEVHGRPESALSDGPNALPLRLFEPLVRQLQSLDRTIKGQADACTAEHAQRDRP
jgi:2-dehydro-3-deoxyphosphooctonate aldolase (KDO 8-P synthase)